MKDRKLQQSEPTVTMPLSVAAAVRQWASATPTKAAFRYLKEDGTHDVISYSDLHRWARAIGAVLRRDYAPGTRALLMFPHGLDFIAAFLGCVYSGIVAVPICAPRLNRPSTPTAAIIRNCQPQLVLSTDDYGRRREQIFRQIPELLSLAWMQTEVYRDLSLVEDGNDDDDDPTALALLQYTSGSTGAPKGVMVTRANLAHNSSLIQQAFGSSPATRGVFWLPHYHDMGLIGSILGTLYCGGTSVLMSPLTLIRRPLTWLEAITQTRATITGGPDFSYALCADKISPAQRAALDLSSLEVAFTGAEPVRFETLERFSDAFASCGFRRDAFFPCYGLAEATLIVSSRLPTGTLNRLDVDADALERHRAIVAHGEVKRRHLVSCGNPLSGQEVRIVDPSSQEDCAVGEVGEIWVRGQSISHGYWDNPEATENTFYKLPRAGGAPYLRTGDLGVLHVGELYVTGRLKDVIIVRGRNLYPQDIEWTVRQSGESLQGAAAAFSLEVAGQEELIVTIELERRAGEEQYAPMIQAVRQAIGSEHEVAVHAVVLVRLGTIPRTSSGKVRRNACREAYLKGMLEPLHVWIGDGDVGGPVEVESTTESAIPATALSEAEIRHWLSAKIAVLMSLPEPHINVTAPFSSFGLSSLQGVMLVEQLQTIVGREVPATWIYNYPTISELAHRLVTPDPQPLTAEQMAARDEGLWHEVNQLSTAELQALVAGKMTELT